MNYFRNLVILIAAFFLIIPAFSIQDDGHSMGCSDNQQKTFDNQNPMMGHDDQQQIGLKSMMGNDGKKIVCLTICKVIGGVKEQAGAKSMMGEKGQDGKDKTCTCQNSVKVDQGQDCRQNSWNDGQQNTCGCRAGQEQAGVKSMMGEKEQDGKDKTCDCQNSLNDNEKSGNGESEQNGQHNSWNQTQESWNGNSKQNGQENTDESQ